MVNVETYLNPYEGLKHNLNRDFSISNVETYLNPYEGLKLRTANSLVKSAHVETYLNPYEGLKQCSLIP